MKATIIFQAIIFLIISEGKCYPKSRDEEDQQFHAALCSHEEKWSEWKDCLKKVIIYYKNSF